MRDPRRLTAARAVAAACLALAVMAACGATPTASPGGSGPWRVATVAPAGAGAQVPAGMSIGDFCSPCAATGESELAAVAAGPGGLTGVGYTAPGPQAAIWHAADGNVWQPAAGFTPPPRSALLAVVAGPKGWVAVGTVARAGAAWRSPDGATWTAADAAGLTTPGTVELAAVTSDQAGYLAGGAVIDQAGQAAATIWRSGDGLTWTAQALPGGADGEVHGLASSGAVTMAVGWSSTVTGVDHALAWWTTDGQTWHAASLETATGTRAQAITRAGGAWVVVGSREEGEAAAAWTSADGQAWTAAPTTAALQGSDGGQVQLLAVVPAGSGVVGVGWRDSSGNGNGTAWTSPDGLAWQRLPDATSFSGAILSGATSSTSSVIVVGAIGRPDNPTATVWLTTPAALASTSAP